MFLLLKFCFATCYLAMIEYRQLNDSPQLQDISSGAVSRRRCPSVVSFTGGLGRSDRRTVAIETCEKRRKDLCLVRGRYSSDGLKIIQARTTTICLRYRRSRYSQHIEPLSIRASFWAPPVRIVPSQLTLADLTQIFFRILLF